MPPAQQQCSSDRPAAWGSAPAVSSSYHLKQEYYRGRRISTAGLTEIGENEKGSKQAKSYAVGDIEGPVSDRRTPPDLNRGFLLVESTAETRQQRGRGVDERTEDGSVCERRKGAWEWGPSLGCYLKFRKQKTKKQKSNIRNKNKKCFLHANPLALIFSYVGAAWRWRCWRVVGDDSRRLPWGGEGDEESDEGVAHLWDPCSRLVLAVPVLATPDMDGDGSFGCMASPQNLCRHRWRRPHAYLCPRNHGSRIIVQ